MSNDLDSTPEPVRALLEMLRGDLATIRFPDVDGDKLAAAAREVEEATLAVAAAEAALAAARSRLDERQDALLARAQRALGYLRVFAEGDAALESRLASIVLPRRGNAPDVTPPAGEPRRRGRPPKRDVSTPLLPSVAAPELSAGATADAHGQLRVLPAS